MHEQVESWAEALQHGEQPGRRPYHTAKHVTSIAQNVSN